VINAAAGSLQRLLWSINTENRKYLIFSCQIFVLIPLAANHISLNQLCRLEFLTLRASLEFKRISDLPDWGQHFQIKKILKDSFIPQTLKRLTIIVVWGAGSTGSDWRDIHDSMVWKDLELVPLISIYVAASPYISSALNIAVRSPDGFWYAKFYATSGRTGNSQVTNRIQISFGSVV
jgi:hypothetical protein